MDAAGRCETIVGAGVIASVKPEGQALSIIIHTFDRGGIGRVAGYLARGFAEAGYAVEVLVFARGGETQDVVEKLIGARAAIHYLGRSSGVRPLDFLLGLFPLVRRLRASRPQIVVSAANNCAIVAAAAFRLAGLAGSKLFLKTSNPIASSRHRGLVRWVRRLTYRMTFRHATAVWTMSADESREMDEAFPDFRGLFHVVPNPYVTTAMLEYCGKSPVPTAGRTVICVARLYPQKRLERLIAAFAHVRHHGAQLQILGEGEERAKLEALVAQLGLGDRVELPGQCLEVAPALHAADLFVLTSDYEGLPAVVLEAMATNCPVLSTDCFSAARSLLTTAEGCGIIEDVSPAGIAALIDAHLKLPRPTRLRALAERYTIPAGIRGHIEAVARHV